MVIEVVFEKEEETKQLPSGEMERQSIEGESLGIAIPSFAIQNLLSKIP
jgi:hypothetical protein